MECDYVVSYNYLENKTYCNEFLLNIKYVINKL